VSEGGEKTLLPEDKRKGEANDRPHLPKARKGLFTPHEKKGIGYSSLEEKKKKKKKKIDLLSPQKIKKGK